MITNIQAGTSIHEIADGIYRINTPVTLPGGVGQFNFNQYLILDDAPMLFHTGPRQMFPLVSEAIAAVTPLRGLRYIGFSHPANGIEHLHLFVPHRLGGEPRGGLHRDQREQRQKMILEHVADHPGFLVVAGPAADTVGLSRLDLYPLHVTPIPDRLEDRVGKAEHQKILNRFFAEKVIDAVDLVLGNRAALAVDPVAVEKKMKALPKRAKRSAKKKPRQRKS